MEGLLLASETSSDMKYESILQTSLFLNSDIIGRGTHRSADEFRQPHNVPELLSFPQRINALAAQILGSNFEISS